MSYQRAIPKSVFKARALEFFREVEQTGDEIVITDRGKPVLRILPFVEESTDDILNSLRNTIVHYEDPLEPTGEEWEAMS